MGRLPEIQTVPQILAENLDRGEQSLLGDGLVWRDGKVWMYGPTGRFKSFAAMQMAFSIASGLPWFNWVTQKARVLYAQAEIPKLDMQDRVNSMQKRWGTEGISFLTLRGWALENRQSALDLKKRAVDAGAEVLIIDPVTQVLAGSENNDRDVRYFTRVLEDIQQELSLCLFCVHHSRKGTFSDGKVVDSGYGENRGHSHLIGWPDTILHLKGSKERDKVTLVWEKTRSTEEPADLKLKFNKDKLLLEVSEEQPERVAMELLEHGPMALGEFMVAFQEKTQVGIQKSQRLRHELEKAGELEVIKDPVDKRKTLVRKVE